MSIPVPHKIVTAKGVSSVVAFIPGTPEPLLAEQSHPNYAKILDACKAGVVEGLADLFDVAKAVERRFKRLSDRVAVRGGEILLDGDPVDGTLQSQILAFLDAGEDFKPLVNFYEKLLTNPLGDVRQGVYDWITGQTANGALTITPDGNLLGYKSMTSGGPATKSPGLFRPSRTGAGVVNGVEVPASEYLWQKPGDVVEMPRSKVLHAPSQACGDGLHIGTFQYASGFSGDTVMLVEFNPRDIVSLPDSNASWKLRVCRYTNVKTVTEPLQVPVYATAKHVAKVDVVLDGRAVTQGRTSVAAKGAGRNPAQDNLGRFSGGRPGSKRDASGRFAG